MSRKRRKRRYVKHNGKSFHSKIERDVYKVLLKYFKDDDIIRQKLYFEDGRKFTCDFYFPNLNPPTWIEVSNYLKPRYLSKIKKKRSWIESRNEVFVFISDPLVLEGHLQTFYSSDGVEEVPPRLRC
jgi:hypothetical protein